VHCQQGGLCVIIGDRGTGKSVIKQALIQHDPKRLIVPVVNRTLHIYTNVLRILCQALCRRRTSDSEIDSDGQSFACDKEAITYYRVIKAECPQLKITALFDANIDDEGNGDSAFKTEGLVEILTDYNAAYGRNFDFGTHGNFKKDLAAASPTKHLKSATKPSLKSGSIF